MIPTTRPPPAVLLIHNGDDGYKAHINYLTNAGLRVSETHGNTALAVATSTQPDLIVLDFGCDGETTALLKGNPETQRIPVIALVDLIPQI